MTKLMDDERIKKFTPLEFKNLPRYPNGDLHIDFWNEDFRWLKNIFGIRIRIIFLQPLRPPTLVYMRKLKASSSLAKASRLLTYYGK